MAAHIAKRPRLHGPNNPALSLASTSSLLESTRQSAAATPKLRHLQAEHENSLRQSALRLKSNWEDICRRYGRDFSGETDEIDLHTGQVVVDNGHLRNLSEHIGDTWAFDDEFSGGSGAHDDDDGDEEEDATSLEMEIMGMASSDMLGSGRLGVAMPRDDEAEEVDVDEMDDLFDELEELTMTMKPAVQQQEKQTDAPSLQSSPPSAQKDPTGQGSIPSPARSVDGAMPSPLLQAALKPVETNAVDELPSLDDMPPDEVILEKLGPVWGSALLARVRGLPESAQIAEVEEEQPEPSFNAQLTPVSDYATPLVERSTDEMDDAESAEENKVIISVEASDSIDEQLDILEEEVEAEVLELEVTSGSEAEVEERLESVKSTLEITLEVSSGPDSETEQAIAATSDTHDLEDGTLNRPFMIEDTPEPEPEPTTDTVRESSSPPIETMDNDKAPEPSREPSAVPEQLTVEEQPADREPEPVDPNYLYGDIDDLSTISSPRSLVPVTPKNRFRITSKSKSTVARKIVFAKRGRPPKRLPSDLSTPAKHAMSSPLRAKQPPSTLKRPRQVQHTPSQPRNFWSAMPDDPFYDPMWQDYHPDGEPAFEDFEQRKALLQAHSSKNVDSDTVMQDELLPLASSPPTAKKTPGTKIRQTPNKNHTPRSQKVNPLDVFESKLRTPRSGRFLEHTRKKVGENDGVKTEEEASGDGDTSVAKTEDVCLETPSGKVKNEYGLSDSEDELSRELWFVKDKDLEITGSRKRRRKTAVREPLVVPDDSSMLVKVDGVKEEDDDAARQQSLATCGDPGYRCKKIICFSKLSFLKIVV
ncbi:hypothetical protein ABW21_db0201888 [Orbilia brochopaga]|nr:hypothetical protein ABW21_db0201888 [Drechslerella brochopaga]